MAKAASAVPEGDHTITPQLTLDDAAKMIDWYKKALGADEFSRSAGPDGKIMHAELKIGHSRFMLADAMPGMKGPKGAQVQMPVDNQFRGDRGGAVSDPNGYTWWIATRKDDLTRAELDQRAQDFFKQQMAQPTSR